MRAVFAFLFVMGLLAACGGDDTGVSDSGADAKKIADAGPDTPYGDASYVPDSADAAYVPMACDPNNDAGDPCGTARKCCPINYNGPDGGPNYGCVFLKPPNDTCPTPGG